MYSAFLRLRTLPPRTNGETLVEVLAAVAIFTIVMTGVFATLAQSLNRSADLQSRVIALSLTQEALEATRQARDTRWLLDSSDPRASWLLRDTSPSNTSSFTSGHYRVQLTTNRWFLQRDTDDPAITVNTPLDLTDGADTFYQLYRTPTGTYTHSSTSPNTPTSFYRSVTVNLLNPYDHDSDGTVDNPSLGFCNTAGDSCSDRKLQAIATTQWREGDRVESITLETQLFDFYQRTSYDG